MESVQLLALILYAQWKHFRKETNSHKLHCNCEKCGERRKLGAKLVLPYSGPVRQIALR